MNTITWIIQLLLSTMMLVIGMMKTFRPVAQLSKFTWTTRNSVGFVRFVGVSELLIGIGLVLPWLTGVLPILTSIAAAALCLIMILAIVDHIENTEAREIWKNVVVLIMAGSVAIVRFIPE